MSDKRPLILTFLLAASTAAMAAAAPSMLTVNPSRDGTLYEDGGGVIANGAGIWMFTGLTGANAGNILRRTIVAFDLSAIPPGSTVQSVEVSFTIDAQLPPGASPGTATLHRVTSDWGEGASVAPGPQGGGGTALTGDATWIHTFFDTQTWSTPGGDFQATPTASAGFGNGPETLTFTPTPELIAEVQGWVNAPASNFGWMLIGDESSGQNARRIASRENTGSPPPSMTITFLAAPAGSPPASVPTFSPAGLWLLVGAFLAMGLWVRGRPS